MNRERTLSEVGSRLPTLSTEIKLVEALLSSRQYHEALEKCADLRARYPRSPSVFWIQASVKGHLKDFSGAVDDLSEVIKLQPDEPRGYFMRGWDLLQLKRSALAIDDFTEVLRLSKLWESNYYVEAAYFCRAEALVRCRRFREARQDCMHVSDGFTGWSDSLRSKEAILADCDAGERSGKG